MDIDDFRQMGTAGRIALVVGAVIIAHVAVHVVRRMANRVMAGELQPRQDLQPRLSKTRTVTSLASSLTIFTLYFGAVGFALSEVGVPLATYLAATSVIGLAVAFGSQGVVQDVMTGITIIFSDIFDVGDMVEIGGQAGIVRRLGMRFTVLTNAMGADVYIPNRSIANVINYPRGYVRCIADITLPSDETLSTQAEEAVRLIVAGAAEQFSGILRTAPDIERIMTTSTGRRFMRIKFRIWPGRGGPIETQFRQEVTQSLRKLDSAYADWMVSVAYEVERRQVRLGSRR